jgi:hypothetical protein
MFHTGLIYGFPFILMLFEWGFRQVIGADTLGFVGPTLAAAGVTFLVPLTKPNQVRISEKVKNALMQKGITAVYEKDQNFIYFVYFILLISSFVWLWSCFVSMTTPNDLVFSTFPTHVGIGFINYITAIILCWYKEAINESVI